MTIKRLSYAFVVSLLTGNTALADDPEYLKLKNHLDRSGDGYCFDVQGVVGHFRADKPLVAHNCKSGSAPDGLVEYKQDGALYFPAFDQCVTAMGTGTTVLPGTSLMLKPCIEKGVFASPAMQKRFSFRSTGQLELAGTGLCVTVGDRSAQTLSSRDRWRTLYLDVCQDVPAARSEWSLVTPYK